MYNNEIKYLAELRQKATFDWRIYLDKVNTLLNENNTFPFHAFILYEAKEPFIPQNELLIFISLLSRKAQSTLNPFYLSSSFIFYLSDPENIVNKNNDDILDIIFYLLYYNHISEEEIHFLDRNKAEMFILILSLKTTNIAIKQAALIYFDLCFPFCEAQPNLLFFVAKNNLFQDISVLFQKYNSATGIIHKNKRKKMINNFVFFFQNNIDNTKIMNTYFSFLDMLYSDMGEKTYIILKYILNNQIKDKNHFLLLQYALKHFYDKEKEKSPFDNYLYYFNKAIKDKYLLHENIPYYESLIADVIQFKISQQQKKLDFVIGNNFSSTKKERL